jgi:L,D-transpeptidase YbiS
MPPTTEWILVDLGWQRLHLMHRSRILDTFPISTSARGAGERLGSEQTPRGRLRIRLAIGAGCPTNTVFVGRRPTGEVLTPELASQYPARDWILTRILWLTGLEPGLNRGGTLDTLRRYIYIHGCPDAEPMGVPRSHGCIRMRNHDILDLFERVGIGTLVEIKEEI